MKTVLIVDDIPFVRATLKKIFEGAGYRVVGEAEDGAQALSMYEKLEPHLVTVDLVMPKMSGIELTKKIMKVNKKANVLVISALKQEQLVMDAIQAGAKDYILKPFQASDLIQTAEHILSDLNENESKATHA